MIICSTSGKQLSEIVFYMRKATRSGGFTHFKLFLIVTFLIFKRPLEHLDCVAGEVDALVGVVDGQLAA